MFVGCSWKQGTVFGGTFKGGGLFFGVFQVRQAVIKPGSDDDDVTAAGDNDQSNTKQQQKSRPDKE